MNRRKAAKTKRGKLKRPNTPRIPQRHRLPTRSKKTRVAQLIHDRDEALGQLAATSEVLRVISSSPGELKPVFESMLANAMRICEAQCGFIYKMEAGVMGAMAEIGVPPALAEYRRNHQHTGGATTPVDVMRATKKPAHVHDARESEAYRMGNPNAVAGVDLGGARTVLYVPMLKEGEIVGVINVYRQVVRPFADDQIALLENFAAQAVIAIENARLLSELRQRTDDLSESLEQQTATSEVLKIISSSPGELKPVFRAMLEQATSICDAKFGIVFRYEGGLFHPVASLDLPSALADFMAKQGPFAPQPGQLFGHLCESKTVINVVDRATDPNLSPSFRYGGARSSIAVPMLKDDELVGALFIYRTEVRPFTDKQIELVKNFAAQAVIAIENTRLLTELRQRTDDLTESLEELRTTQDRLVQTQKLALLGQLTAGIAHEIKNPLNFVNNFSGISAELIDELQDTLKGISLGDKARTDINELTDTLKSNFDKVVHHGRRADAIVKNMLQHSREGSGEHRVIDINALVEESLNLAWHGARAETQGFDIKLKKSFDPSAGGADIFSQDIRRALLNMISNAFYAATRRRAETNGGGYEPTLTASTKNLGDHVEIRIRDNGTGMTPDVKEKMFNPFFTTKPTGEGAGLGLSISHDIIVKQHGGSIEVETQPDEFTEIRVILPRMAALLPERP